MSQGRSLFVALTLCHYGTICSGQIEMDRIAHLALGKVVQVGLSNTQFLSLTR